MLLSFLALSKRLHELTYRAGTAATKTQIEEKFITLIGPVIFVCIFAILSQLNRHKFEFY